jgi:hypothetical protein
MVLRVNVAVGLVELGSTLGNRVDDVRCMTAAGNLRCGRWMVRPERGQVVSRNRIR